MWKKRERRSLWGLAFKHFWSLKKITAVTIVGSIAHQKIVSTLIFCFKKSKNIFKSFSCLKRKPVPTTFFQAAGCSFRWGLKFARVTLWSSSDQIGMYSLGRAVVWAAVTWLLAQLRWDRLHCRWSSVTISLSVWRRHVTHSSQKIFLT